MEGKTLKTRKLGNSRNKGITYIERTEERNRRQELNWHRKLELKEWEESREL